MNTLEKLKQQGRRLKRETYTLYLAARDARTPWYAKLLIAVVVGYAFSPIDLIPDFIPILGYLDDLVLIPIGVALVLHFIPPEVLAECRERAQALIEQGKPVNRVAAFVILSIWIAVVVWVGIWIYQYIGY